MRKLILQMQSSIDAYVATPDGSMDWLIWDYGEKWTWSPELRKYHIETIASTDTILMSSKMANQGFIDHWNSVAEQGDNPQSVFARHVANEQKIVFSRHPMDSRWQNTITSTNLVNEITSLKAQEGMDMIAFGGAEFASSLLREDLIDELHLITNPVILGKGLSIFNGVQGPRRLLLADAQRYDEGILVVRYTRQ